MAENRFLDKDGLSILVTKIKTELDNVDDVLLFKGIVDDAEVLQGSVSSISQISYISSKKVFAGYNRPSYYNNWGTRAKYCNEAGKPIGGKIFIDVDTYKVYTWNGGDLREVLGKDLATINRVLDSLPADILTDISATTDAESITLSFAAAGKGSKGDYGAANAKEIVLNPATPNDAGLMSAADKKKIDKAATLDEQGKVPSSQLPSFVDDVQEFHGLVENVELTDVYYSDMHRVGIVFDKTRGKFIGKYSRKMRPLYSEDITTELNNDIAELNTPTEPAPQSGKIYVDVTTNKTYRWSGSNLVEISASLALGETENTAFAGNRGVALEGEVAGLKESVETKADKDFVGNNLNSITRDISNIKTSAIKNIRPSYDATHVNLSQEKIEGAAVNISIDTATSSKAGAMSAADKEKLDNFIDSEGTRNRNETARVSAETGRAAAETARAKAETARADAETQRSAAETKRETDFSAKVNEVDTAVTNANTATAGAEKVDATITDANVFEVTGRDGVKKSLGLVGQAEAATIKTELAGKLDKASVVQELGDADDKVVSQKAVSEKINDIFFSKLNLNSNTESVIKDNSDAFYFADSQGNVIGKLDKNGFHAIEVSSKKSNVSIIKDNDDTFYFADGYGNVVAKLDKNGFRANDFLDRNGNSIIKSLPMDDFGVEDGYSLINKEKKIVASKKKISPLFGKNIYSFGDSLCSGVWEKYLAEMTGAIFNEKANMLTSWGGTFSGDTGGPLYNEEGYGKNGDMPGGARRATNFINMDEATYGTKDYIFFENVHDGSIELNEGEDSIQNAIPFFVQQFKTAEYEAIDNNDAISYFNNNFTNLIALFDEPKPCSVIKIKINTFSHKLVFSGDVREGVISIKIGNKTFDTNIKDNDSLDEVIDKINVWSFADTTAWKNSKIDATSMQLIYTGQNEGSKEDIITVDCGTTGLNCVISDSMSNSIRNMMFKSLDVTKWNDISLWEYATNYDNSINWWKGIIERIQTRCPNTKMYMCIFPNYAFNDSYIRADGSFDVDSWKKATSSYAKKNRHLLTLIADYYNIPVIDVEKEMMVMTNWKEFFSPNNVHFKNNLHQRIAEIISNHIVV